MCVFVVNIYIYIYIYIYMYIYIYVCVCLFVCGCVFLEPTFFFLINALKMLHRKKIQEYRLRSNFVVF